MKKLLFLTILIIGFLSAGDAEASGGYKIKDWSLSFDGSDDFVTASVPQISGATAITIQAKIKENFPGTGFRSWFGFRRIDPSADANNSLYIIRLNSVNLEIRYRNGAGTAYTTTYSHNERKQDYILATLVFTGSKLNTYFDNTLVSSIDASGDFGTTNIPNFSVGRLGDRAQHYGRIKGDDARVWNRALTPTEISDLYYNNIVPQSGLVAECLFNEGSGTTALDTSGNGNNGTITGAVYSSNTPLNNTRSRTLNRYK